MTYKEIIYMCLDELHLTSDDSLFNEDHILFLINKYRAFLLKQRYSDIKRQIPESNYQTICLDLQKAQNIEGLPCSGVMLKSVQQIPNTIKIGNPKIYPQNYYLGEITYVSRERMRYVGHNKYLQNIIYASLGTDWHLYLKSSNPQHLYLEKVKMTGIFEDPQKAATLECNEDGSSCNLDVMEKTFPLEEGLVPNLIELIIKELGDKELMKEDEINDAKDGIADQNRTR